MMRRQRDGPSSFPAVREFTERTIQAGCSSAAVRQADTPPCRNTVPKEQRSPALRALPCLPPALCSPFPSPSRSPHPPSCHCRCARGFPGWAYSCTGEEAHRVLYLRSSNAHYSAVGTAAAAAAAYRSSGPPLGILIPTQCSSPPLGTSMSPPAFCVVGRQIWGRISINNCRIGRPPSRLGRGGPAQIVLLAF